MEQVKEAGSDICIQIPNNMIWHNDKILTSVKLDLEFDRCDDDDYDLDSVFDSDYESDNDDYESRLSVLGSIVHAVGSLVVDTTILFTVFATALTTIAHIFIKRNRGTAQQTEIPAQQTEIPSQQTDDGYEDSLEDPTQIES